VTNHDLARLEREQGRVLVCFASGVPVMALPETVKSWGQRGKGYMRAAARRRKNLLAAEKQEREERHLAVIDALIAAEQKAA